MESLNQEESFSLNRSIAGTIDVTTEVRDADPLSVPASLGQDNNSRINTLIMSNFGDGEGDNGNDTEFTPASNRSAFRSFLRYTRSILALVSTCVLDLTSANNISIVSKIVRILFTVFTYTTIYTGSTGMLLWAVAYLMDHGWYLLAVTCSIMLLFVSAIVLAFYEWMWLWQGRAISFLCSGNDSISTTSGYNRLRIVNILDDDDMEDDLTLRGWIKQVTRALISCFIWSLYCVFNVKAAFWISNQYLVTRPTYYTIELLVLNYFEAAPILLGAAVLLYFAYPNIFHYVSSSSYTYGTLDTITESFASSGNADSERYTIVVDQDNEVTMGVGMQNLKL